METAFLLFAVVMAVLFLCGTVMACWIARQDAELARFMQASRDFDEEVAARKGK